MRLRNKPGVARAFADMLHTDAGQTYDGAPYVQHLDAVVQVLTRFGETSTELLAAGYLHDIWEDSDVDLDTLEDLFGEEVRDLVYAVSDEPGETRQARKAATYPKIAMSCGATKLKLADRIANVEHGIRTGNKKMLAMYSDEYPGFRLALNHGHKEEAAMWDHLDYISVAFGL